MNNTKKDNTAGKIAGLSLFAGLMITIAQTAPFIQNASHGNHVFAMILMITIFLGIFVHLFFSKKLNYQSTCLWIALFGIINRSFFVLMADITSLQNDVGTYTGYGTDTINNGHIGYIEYIYKFRALPNMDPYEHFGYFHPPLHHLIEALWLTLQRAIGIAENVAFENLQIPTLIYSCLCIAVMYKILTLTNLSKKYYPAGLLIFALHPRMLVAAGAVNNDALALLFLMCTIWRMMEWLKDKTFKNIILIALSLGFGMITKLNVAICAFSIAVLYLSCFIKSIKTGNLVITKKLFLQYVVFGIICIPIGLSYIVRNLILFGEKPGIPAPSIPYSDSYMYTGSYSLWSYIGFPLDWNYVWPFHGASAAYEHNAWIILFKTSLFAEVFPAGLDDYVLSIAQIAYFGAIVAGIVLGIFAICYMVCQLIKKTENSPINTVHGCLSESDCINVHSEINLFMLLTFVFMLLSYIMFVIKYPFTCSCDFRYMVACLVFTSIAFAQMQTALKNRAAGRIVLFITNFALACALLGSNLVFLFWNVV